MTREQIEEWKTHFKAEAQTGGISMEHWDELRTLCDLALAALSGVPQRDAERYRAKREQDYQVARQLGDKIPRDLWMVRYDAAIDKAMLHTAPRD